MNVPQMDDQFSAAFRAKLVDHVGRDRPRRRRRTMIGIGATLSILLGGTVAAAASGLLALPGAVEVEPLGATRSEAFVGSGAIDLGARPDRATGIALSFTCLSPGNFAFADGASVTCSSVTDIGQPTTYVLPLSSNSDSSISVATGAYAVWTLTAGYVAAETTDWAVNESAQTYGVINDRGTPDLIAVIATNGKQGYVHRADLEQADGTSAAREFKSPEEALAWQKQNASGVRQIPVYQQDGTTLIGEFLVG
jgi:hypothetical protein